MYCRCQFVIFSVAAVVLSIFVLAIPAEVAAEKLTMQLHATEYQIVPRDEGQVIKMEGYGYLNVPGKPMLPAKNFLIALPPGARVRSAEVIGTAPVELPGTYQIVPCPPVIPLVDPQQFTEGLERVHTEWVSNNQAIYSSNQPYPSERGRLAGSGSLRKYSYASISFYPFSYHPQSGKLIHHDGAEIKIEYYLPSPGTPEAQKVEESKWDVVAHERAFRLFENFEQMRGFYQPAGTRPKAPEDSYDYVIITTAALQSAVVASNFLDWKASLGHNIRIVLVTDSEITSQPGTDLPEQIRNFLRSYYIPWGIQYVLLVADNATIPMRYCYPDPGNHANGAGNPSSWPWAGDVPTDYYYADLSDPDDLSWDSDGDGYHGEYGQDNPDFLAEVYVGRIATNVTSRITYALNKLVTFEQDTGVWKNGALHAGAFWYLSNEDNNGMPAYDGATCMNEIETNLMSGWNVSHYSEQAGLEVSVFPWPALSEAAFASDWRNGQYSIVNWGAHGWTDGAARKAWSWDDGDGVPEASEMSWPYFIGTNSNLDDDHPSILFPISCVINYPEPNAWGNIGIDLLTEPSWGACVGVVAATRVVYGASGWPTNPGGGESMCYEFNRFMIDGPSGPEKVGDAVYDSKFFCNQNYGFAHYAEYWNMFTYNLYGDPSLVREGVSRFVCGDCNKDSIIDVADVIHLLNYLYKNGPAPDPPESGDCNCDEIIDLGDAIHLINYLFKQGPSPCET